MKNMILTAALLAVLTFVGCINDDDGFINCPAGSGSLVETSFEFDNFTGIELQCSGDVFITQGDEFSVLTKIQANIVDRLDLSVDDGILEIDLDGCLRDFTLDVFITMPAVDYLRITSSGDMHGENEFTGENLRLRITGSGNMDFRTDYETIDARVTGSGEIDLEGACNEFEYKISGSGDINSFDLIADEGLVEITGSGDAEVFVNEFLSVKITGSGDVFFKGNPDEIVTDISGSGDVRDAN